MRRCERKKFIEYCIWNQNVINKIIEELSQGNKEKNRMSITKKNTLWR